MNSNETFTVSFYIKSVSRKWSQIMSKNICKINLALSDQPLYVAVNDENMSLDSIFTEAVSSLQNAGRTHEAQQLSALYKDHEIFSGGKVVSKGTAFKDLQKETRSINNEQVNFGELELMTQHVGG